MLPNKQGQRDPHKGKGERLFCLEQRDPHGEETFAEGSHLNASKADFFFLIIQVSFFFEIVLIIFVRNS